MWVLAHVLETNEIFWLKLSDVKKKNLRQALIEKNFSPKS